MSDEQVRVHAALQQAKTAMFCTFHDGAINARCMLFACDDSLSHFFLLTHRATEKFEDLEADCRATLCVLSLPESGALEDSSETTVQGSTVVTADFSEPQVPDALWRLSKKQPQLEALLQAKTLGDYRMVAPGRGPHRLPHLRGSPAQRAQDDPPVHEVLSQMGRTSNRGLGGSVA